jgi:hypothetical protein
METKTFTPEQQKALNKLGVKFLLSSLLNGAYHAAMMVLMNVVTTLAVLALELPEFLMYIGAGVAGIFVFRRMLSIAKQKHDTFILEAKKIIEQ